MNLVAIAQKATDIGFAIAGQPSEGGALETVTLHLGKAEAYDYDTGKSTESGGTDPTVDGLFYMEEQAQGGPTANRGIFLVKGVDAPTGIFEADTLTREGKVWQIDLVEPIPTKAVWLIHIRR